MPGGTLNDLTLHDWSPGHVPDHASIFCSTGCVNSAETDSHSTHQQKMHRFDNVDRQTEVQTDRQTERHTGRDRQADDRQRDT